MSKKKMMTERNKIQADDPSKRVVIAYGAAKFAPGGKGEISVPTDRAYKECKNKFLTIPVDEFRTTNVANEDDSMLRMVKRKDLGKCVRGLLWYDSPRCSKFLDRDLNAALNIRRCVTSPVRPLALVRSNPALRPIPKGYGIVIKH